MTDTFSVGDTVTALRNEGTVTYGPFSSTFDRYTMYVVRHEDGNEKAYHETDMSARPAFVVGDTVKYEYGGGGKLVAGPFKSGYHDEAIWVVEQADGTHMTPTQNALTKVTPAADTFAYGGVTYDLTAKYRDAAGDIWQLSHDEVSGPSTKDGNNDGTPLARTSDDDGDTSGAWVWSLAEGVRYYGPLTRI